MKLLENKSNGNGCDVSDDLFKASLQVAHRNYADKAGER
jgi:hypothetical protein